MSRRVTLGIDFGTLSARALLLDMDSGIELGTGVCEYPHGVMGDELHGIVLPLDFALQDPLDYLYAIEHSVAAALQSAGCAQDEVVAIGIDFTASTVLPVRANGTPLCCETQFADEPHAWCKLWKHHGAQEQTDQIQQAAEKIGWLDSYGGKVSSEYMMPKALEVLQNAPTVYRTADLFVEAGDWIVWQLCGELVRSNCQAGFKSFWEQERGYPSIEFLSLLNPEFAQFATQKLSGEPSTVGATAGQLTEEWAAKLGLTKGIPIAVAIIDAHASMAGCGIAEAEKLLMIVGTSTCHIILDKQKHNVAGINGVVKDAIVDGYYAYEAGQCCVGDSFSWYIDNCLPASYHQEAKQQGVGLHAYLRNKSEQLGVGESGLVMMDWLNGVRSPLMDFGLSAVMVGMTLDTKPEQIYRAMIESTAYGARRIVENFAQSGVKISAVYATGGIASKDAMTMQIYADVLGLPVRVAGGKYSGARGSAIYAAITVVRASNPTAAMKRTIENLGDGGHEIFLPNPESKLTYDRLYKVYRTIGDLFAETQRGIMKELKDIKNAHVGLNK